MAYALVRGLSGVYAVARCVLSGLSKGGADVCSGKVRKGKERKSVQVLLVVGLQPKAGGWSGVEWRSLVAKSAVHKNA